MTFTISDHHPATLAVLDFFAWEHLPDGPLRNMSQRYHAYAVTTLYEAPPGPEVTVGLRKLLEAKDCFVRSCLPPKAKPGEL